jgi:hypothetical protein
MQMGVMVGADLDPRLDEEMQEFKQLILVNPGFIVRRVSQMSSSKGNPAWSARTDGLTGGAEAMQTTRRVKEIDCRTRDGVGEFREPLLTCRRDAATTGG